ncbi:MAG: ABC transporter permease [Acidimicrobiia bacterium]|nr:ABC transporter permease [Acidimicrobiia bacterium]
MNLADLWKRSRIGVVAVALALVVGVLLLLVAGANPFEAFGVIIDGSLGSTARIGDTLMVWAPLVLAAAGLLITFAAGLWNIGVEGQITFGAIAASLIAREVSGPTWLIVTLALLAGLLGGAFWALLAGLLRTYGKVNEIFGGLGLHFVATALAVYLVLGPWKRAGVASTSGTEPFPEESWLPTIGSTRLSWLAVLVAVAAVVAVFYLLRGTRFGLRLKAVGKNMRSAFLLGIPTGPYMLAAFALGGGLAGLAGAIQATGFHHKLVPSISGGYGFLGILVAMLAGYAARWIAPIALVFAILAVGSTLLPLKLGLDSSVGGVLQGVLVLFTVLAQGWQSRRKNQQSAVDMGPPEPPIIPGEVG